MEETKFTIVTVRESLEHLYLAGSFGLTAFIAGSLAIMFKLRSSSKGEDFHGTQVPGNLISSILAATLGSIFLCVGILYHLPKGLLYFAVSH